ncbi:hypothetical protein [Microbispora sp. ATCC PTA-5024]|uniref:hypothetical protein n=1 Tax=Microbispora sp. ATCC PTA-5024 TaxID=316330 RepID=UPI0003DD6D8A|nr:hypothetical protein [Microbispora sp. ATCC PTA-5024]ETK31191.1 hypothetical protein MPTA5024_36140 [Microbispora sp. ATCC PTA-5024]
MPTFRNVIAGLAISTALTGGAVALSAATGASAASATTATVASCWGNGHGGAWRRCHRFDRFRSERRFRKTVQAALVGVRSGNRSTGDTIVDIDNDAD